MQGIGGVLVSIDPINKFRQSLFEERFKMLLYFPARLETANRHSKQTLVFRGIKAVNEYHKAVRSFTPSPITPHFKLDITRPKRTEKFAIKSKLLPKCRGCTKEYRLAKSIRTKPLSSFTKIWSPGVVAHRQGNWQTVLKIAETKAYESMCKHVQCASSGCHL